MKETVLNKLVDTIIQAIDKRTTRKPKSYYTEADVIRVDHANETAFVHIPDGVDETPVKLTIDAEPGDRVQVRVGEGKATITGNITSPPARGEKVESVVKSVKSVERVAQEASNIAIKDVVYYLATNINVGVTRQTSGWTTTIQQMTSTNPYLWMYHEYTSVDGSKTYSDPYMVGGLGKDGTSVTILGSYNTLAELQAAHPTGSLGDAYMVGGDLYVWNGSAWENVGQIQGPQGPQGPAGQNGTAGVSISSVTEYYLATSASSGVTTSTSGWTTTIQTMTATKQYLWNYEKVTGSNGNTLNTTTPVIIGRYGQNGAAGRGISSITEYYLATSASAGVTTSTSGWTTTMQTTTTTNKYLWNYEHITWTDSTTSDVAPHIIGTHGTSGTNGRGVSSVQTQYYLSTSSSSATGGSWATTPQTFVHGKFYWTRELITYTDGATGYSTAIYNRGLTQANETAYEAKVIAGTLEQHFWMKSSGGTTAVPNGAYVTEIEQADFDDAQGGTPAGGNLLLRSVGVAVRLAAVTLAEFGETTVIGRVLNNHYRIELSQTNGFRVIRRLSSGTDSTVTSITASGIKTSALRGTCFAQQTFTLSLGTVAASSSATRTQSWGTSGMRGIALMGFTASNYALSVFDCTVSSDADTDTSTSGNTTIKVQVRNRASSAISNASVTVRVLMLRFTS